MFQKLIGYGKLFIKHSTVEKNPVPNGLGNIIDCVDLVDSGFLCENNIEDECSTYILYLKWYTQSYHKVPSGSPKSPATGIKMSYYAYSLHYSKQS